MNKLIFILLGSACFSLEAIHYQSSMNVTPVNNGNIDAYLVEMQIEKVIDEHSSPEIIAAPKMLCDKGKTAQLTIASEDNEDLLSIQVFIPENAQAGLKTTILLKEQGEIVLSTTINQKFST